MRYLSLFVLGAFLLAQSPLVELSKKERERRKRVKAVKVITNQDLGKAPKPSLVTSAAPERGGKEGEVNEGALSKGKKKDRNWWASRKKALEEKIASLKKRIEELQRRVNALTTGFLIEQRPMAHQKVKSELEKAKGELERARKELEKAKKELEDLYEKARKAGIPPGWLR